VDCPQSPSPPQAGTWNIAEAAEVGSFQTRSGRRQKAGHRRKRRNQNVGARFDKNERKGITKIVIIRLNTKLLSVNVSLTKELERVVYEKVDSGLYNNASEVIRDALRRAFLPGRGTDLEQDTPELAALLRAGIKSPHVRHGEGGIRKLLMKTRASLRR
jgi:antitoxin ParD1/3/4